jgi:flagellar basal-body rod protein FlgF
MLYGLYLSAQGAQARSTQLDVVANNLANAGTNSFKRDLAVFQAHRSYDSEYGNSANVPYGLSDSVGGMTIAETHTDFTQGSLQKTGGTFDLAISGPGYFRINNGSEEMLSRDGRFTQNANGDLLTADGGYRVLSTEGAPIRISDEAVSVEIAEDGTINERAADGSVNVAARIGLVQPGNQRALQKVGENLYRTDSGVSPVDDGTHLVQGFLESSGVNPVVETMRMIEASRGFETNLNMIKFQDESLARLLTAARP